MEFTGFTKPSQFNYNKPQYNIKKNNKGVFGGKNDKPSIILVFRCEIVRGKRHFRSN
jgi:hypothetical protein